MNIPEGFWNQAPAVVMGLAFIGAGLFGYIKWLASLDKQREIQSLKVEEAKWIAKGIAVIERMLTRTPFHDDPEARELLRERAKGE